MYYKELVFVGIWFGIGYGDDFFNIFCFVGIGCGIEFIGKLVFWFVFVGIGWVVFLYYEVFDDVVKNGVVIEFFVCQGDEIINCFWCISVVCLEYDGFQVCNDSDFVYIIFVIV